MLWPRDKGDFTRPSCPDFSFESQVPMSNCLLNFFISMAQRYLRFNQFNKTSMVSKFDPLSVSPLLSNDANQKFKSRP